MKSPKEVLQMYVDEMNKEYVRLLKIIEPSASQTAKTENSEHRFIINKRINEFDNAINKLN